MSLRRMIAIKTTRDLLLGNGSEGSVEIAQSIIFIVRFHSGVDRLVPVIPLDHWGNI